MPRIEITDKGGWFAYKILWHGKTLWSGDTSRHGTCLAAAQRNRKWIMEAILRGDPRFT